MDPLNEQYFDRIYEDLTREHIKQMQNLKTGMGDERSTQKQIGLINSLVLAIVKLRNFRKQLAERRD